MKVEKKRLVAEILLLLLILLGIFYSFYNMNWDSGALLHPDEYGMANTISQLSIPSSIGNYFNTRESTISPYNKYDLMGNKINDGPDNRMRWGQLPITLIRLTAEAFGQTGYLQLRKIGRYLSAIMNLGTLLLLFLITKRLLNDRLIALLATALSSLAVMQIQQSHFMTSDNFAVFFTTLTLYAAVRISQEEILLRDPQSGKYRVTRDGWLWFALFGVFLGMAVSSKINQAVTGGMLLFAVFINIADLKLTSKKDFNQIFKLAFGMCVFSAVCALLAFRVLQPMSFRAPHGDTGFFTWHFNKDWIDSMLVSMAESSGNGGGPPAEQWAHRTPILFPLINMILYGMGTPLGLAVWISALAAVWKMFRSRDRLWKILLIPTAWSFLYFLFMGTRFVKSIRYMLPVYPTLCLLAAWGIASLWRKYNGRKKILPGVISVLVVGGACLWASLFVKTIYMQPHSRVEAVTWIYDHIPAMIQLEGKSDSEGTIVTIVPSVPSTLAITASVPFESDIRVQQNTVIDRLIIPHAANYTFSDSTLRIAIVHSDGTILTQTETSIQAGIKDQAIDLSLPVAVLLPSENYRLLLSIPQGNGITLRRNILANENWDEGLPFPLYGKDPFGQLYTGITNEIRWPDSENKKEMLLDVLDQADYIILPSQRGIWSSVRIPLTYPMTIDYYESLFDGSLGFELAAQFQRPFKLGPLYFSDLTGKFYWNQAPVLPVKNLSPFAAEEAFSVYDHPPVWIFRKTADFDLSKAKAILDRADLSKVIVQGPTEAVWPEGYADSEE